MDLMEEFIDRNLDRIGATAGIALLLVIIGIPIGYGSGLWHSLAGASIYHFGIIPILSIFLGWALID